MIIEKKMSTISSVKVSVSSSDLSSEEDNDSEYESPVSNGGEPKTKSENTDVSESNKESDDDDVIIKNAAWADSVAKILSSNKPKNKKTLVLSRAKKLADTVKKEKDEKPTFEVVGSEETKKVKTEIINVTSIVSEPPAKKKKVERSSIRTKPNILEKDRERLLTKIATKGVVQLFNAVRNQQKTIEKQIKDIPEGKKEKVLKKFDKRAFLDTLMGQSKSVVVEEQTKPLKDEVKGESEKPRWNALRDDFMMGAKLKDWDKESIDEDN